MTMLALALAGAAPRMPRRSRTARGPLRLGRGVEAPARAGGHGAAAGRVGDLAPARRRLRDLLPEGRFQAVPGGLRDRACRAGRRLRGRGAHYDTKDVPGFVGANDGASGTAVAVQLARTIEPRSLRRSVVFALFDGEESPRGRPTRSLRSAASGGAGSLPRPCATPAR